jgi:DNA-binding NtrC family response regulator
MKSQTVVAQKTSMLIVDDSQIITKRIQQLIRDMKWDGTVDIAHKYNDAIAFISAKQYDMVLLDINLSEKSGIDILEVIKTKELQTKVVMLTNQYNDHYKNICMELGASFFLDKSNEFEKLEMVISELTVTSP